MSQSPIEQIFEHGFYVTRIQLPLAVRQAVKERNWGELDRLIHEQVAPGGAIRSELEKHERFSSIEFIISIRSSIIEPDEDGIWHDDGSRVLAFSLSLTLDSEAIRGGVLEFRRRGADVHAALPTPPFETVIVFATGSRGFEHKINRVAQGERIIIAGWCS